MSRRAALILAQGDPGLFDVLKRVGRAALTTVTGGPLAGVSQLFRPGGAPLAPSGPIGFGPTVGPRLPPPGMVPGLGGASRPPIQLIKVPGVRGALERALPGGATGFVVPGGFDGGGACPSGFHPNKSSYWTSAGFVPRGAKCVRNRRRNLSNGRANTRALSRMAAWDKQERKRISTLKKIARR